MFISCVHNSKILKKKMENCGERKIKKYACAYISGHQH